MTDVQRGEAIVVGHSGVRVFPEERKSVRQSFEFMNSAVSTEKPKGVAIRQIAMEIFRTRESRGKSLLVGGPAIVHTGSAPYIGQLIRYGYLHKLFAGNALATHDIESALYGTSLGIDLSRGHGVEHGHEHHIRAINRIRRAGSIAAAVEQGVLPSGVMHDMVVHDKPFVLVGSVRDDGPLPDVYTDVIEGQRAMRAQLDGVGFAIMVATMLHAIATGNILPASVPLVCVDINPATVTKLSDRGSAHATGIVTDIGLFLEQLAQEVTDYRRPV
jgi:lysine-ketoglutarate reductase/saccharopine dehydrogenase-like protein (TIGR00300 family)